MKKHKQFIIVVILTIFSTIALIAVIMDMLVAKLEFTPVPAQYELDIEKVIVKEGDILATTLSKTQISSQDVNDILKELSKVMDLRHSNPDDFYEILYSSDTKQWQAFWYYPAGSKFYEVRKFSSGLIQASTQTLQTSTTTVRIDGVIESSLWSSMVKKEINPRVILAFADIFAWQVDFLTDTQNGDYFKMIYEEEVISKKKINSFTKILAAQYKTEKDTFNAIYYVTSDNEYSYFDLDGKSIVSAFLKAPLQYRRISSSFSNARMHPILKYIRPHLGIDYAAPTGTPVSAVADGLVTGAQRTGGYGNLVTIRHTNGYESSYGHLSKYGNGIRKGVRVKQGQIIGYVGMTGTATGPHLDFRIKRNGKFFNFLSMTKSPQKILKGKEKEDFLKISEDYIEDLKIEFLFKQIN